MSCMSCMSLVFNNINNIGISFCRAFVVYSLAFTLASQELII